jgi:hypothetical protein
MKNLPRYWPISVDRHLSKISGVSLKNIFPIPHKKSNKSVDINNLKSHSLIKSHTVIIREQKSVLDLVQKVPHRINALFVRRVGGSSAVRWKKSLSQAAVP